LDNLCHNIARKDQIVSVWVEFNIEASINKVVLNDSIGYLPKINSPAIAINNMHEILSKANGTKDALNLKSILVIFNQAIDSKAVEILWKQPSIFLDIIPRLGAFYTIGVLLFIIEKRFAPAGLRDIIIESEVIEEGSAEALLTGKAYNRAVRFLKLLFEAYAIYLGRVWKMDGHDISC